MTSQNEDRHKNNAVLHLLIIAGEWKTAYYLAVLTMNEDCSDGIVRSFYLKQTVVYVQFRRQS